jgi:predicted Zn-dependent protease
MPGRAAATVAMIALLAVSVQACVGSVPKPTPTSPPPTSTSAPTATLVPPTPTPEAREPNYSSPSLGLALWYPATWIVDDMPEAVAFASSSELMSSEDWDTGAAFAVMLGGLEDGQTIKDLIRQQVEASAFEGVETIELEPVAVGDVRGVITYLEATPMGASTTVKGFVAGVERNRRAYLFMGVSVKADWPEFGDTLEAMLRSVRFTEPEGTFTSEDLGLKLWYPEGWILQEEYDQVVFATSRDLIDAGELLTGAALMIHRSSLGDASLVDWFKEELEALTFDEGGINSDMAYRTVAGQEGLIVDLWGVPSGAASPVMGFAVAVAHEDRGYLLLGITALDEWSQYRPTLEEMLDSVQFIK